LTQEKETTMTVTVINPNNSGTVKVGVTGTLKSVECQVINWLLTPSANTTDRPGTYCEAPSSTVGKSSWTLSFDYLQDWGATDSLSQLLFDNDGEVLDFEFAPANDSVPMAKGSFYASAGAFGGDAGSAWQSSGSCPLTAAPTFTAQPAAGADAGVSPAPPVDVVVDGKRK
jgi:hypothetical protein